MSKEIVFNQDARKRIKSGIDKVANAVKATLGPRGRNVVFSTKGSKNATVTNDGVTIAKEITLKDEYENIGANLVKEAASQTNEDAGDGTTTATVLVQSIVEQGLRRVEVGNDAMLIRRGIEKGVNMAVEVINKLAKKISTKEEMKHVATISSGDEEIGEIVADAMDKVGKDGVITVENSNKFIMESDVVNGMLVEKGYISPYMVNQDKTKAELENPLVLVTDQKLSSVNQIVPILEKMATQLNNKNLLLIAGGISGEALAAIIINKMRAGFNIVGIDAPEYGEIQKEILEDIAIMTGATFISESKGIKYDDVIKSNLSDILGKAEKVTCDATETIIIGGSGKEEELDKRVKRLSDLIGEAENDFAETTLKKRLAKLTGGIGVIRVGATTLVEAKEKLYKVEDALNATRAAVEEGIIPGGGVGLIKAKLAIDEYLAGDKEAEPEEVEIGMRILSNALEAPMRQILLNAGIKDIDSIVKKLDRSTNDAGYDFKNIEAGMEINTINAIDNGIVDPVKVTRTALQNAASVAGTVLTTEVAIVDEEEVDKDKK